MYARKLTKEELMKAGITTITEDGHVFRGEEELIPKVNRSGYLFHIIYDFDDDGNLIKIPNEKSAFGYNYKTRSIGLHRIIWAWFHNEVPEGYVVDHVNNRHGIIEDYHLDNLQLLTPKENIAKERICNVKEIKCNLSKPRTYYEEKLKKYEALYETAKKVKDVEAAHHLRTNISQTKARLRYYDSHIKEAKELAEFKKDLEELAAWKKAFKENNNKQLWHECNTIKNTVKETGIEAWAVVKHALEVIHKYFEG